jgi:hypothetical protein
MEDSYYSEIETFLQRVPAIKSVLSYGKYQDDNWWIKFSIDISHDLAWNVVQEFGHVLNYVSLEEKLPVIFYPVSAPPYLNGGPEEFLYWIIESKDPAFTPTNVKEWLVSRLPDPVDNVEEWAFE